MVEKLQRTIAGALGVKESSITLDSSTENVPEWDSLGHLAVVEAFEKDFGISISLDEALELKSVAAWKARLESQGKP